MSVHCPWGILVVTQRRVVTCSILMSQNSSLLETFLAMHWILIWSFLPTWGRFYHDWGRLSFRYMYCYFNHVSSCHHCIVVNTFFLWFHSLEIASRIPKKEKGRVKKRTSKVGVITGHSSDVEVGEWEWELQEAKGMYNVWSVGFPTDISRFFLSGLGSGSTGTRILISFPGNSVFFFNC